MAHSIKTELRKFIVHNFMISDSLLKDDISLIESGIVDSFGFLEIVTFIENRFHIQVKDSALQEGIDSVEQLSHYIENHT